VRRSNARPASNITFDADLGVERRLPAMPGMAVSLLRRVATAGLILAAVTALAAIVLID
jgi:hypothetical protein